MNACPGPCNSAWRRAEAAVDGKGRPIPHQLTAESGDPVWCWRCSRLIAQRLAELDDLVALLQAELGGRRAGIDPTGLKPARRGSPSPSPAVDDVDEIQRTLESWESAYRDLRSLPPRPPRSPELRVTMCISWLAKNLTGALGSDLGKDLGQEVLRLYSMARRWTSTDRATHRKDAPCPRCGRKWLTQHDDGYIRCERASCGRIMTLDEYDAYTLDLARSS